MKKLLLLGVFLLLIVPSVSATETLFNESFSRGYCNENCWSENNTIWTLSTSHANNFQIIGEVGWLVDNVASGDPSAIADITQTTSATFNVSFNWYTDVTDSSIALHDITNTTIIVLRAWTSNLNFLNSSAIYEPINPMNANQWYDISIVLDVLDNTVDVYMDDVIVGENLTPFKNLSVKLGRFKISSQGSGVDSDQRIDNISITGSGLAVNMFFFDENTRQPLTGVDWIVTNSIDNSFNGTGENGTIEGLTGDYEVVYWKDTHFLRRYYLNISAGITTINLYSLNQSKTNAALITYEVQDENGVPLDNVTVKALRFYPELNAYIIVEMSVSDEGGAGGLHLEKIDPKYRFIVEKNGVVILTTAGAQIFQDSILLRADLSEDVIESLVAVVGMQKSLTFSNVTNNFELIWSDSTGVTSEVCLTVSKVALRSVNQVNYTCVSAASGSITLGIGENRTGQYVGRATLETTTAFSPAILTELSVWLENNLASFGGMAIFVSALLIVGVSLTLLFMTNSAIGGIMGVLIGVVFAMMLGILSIGITVVMGLITIGLLVMFLTRARGAT